MRKLTVDKGQIIKAEFKKNHRKMLIPHPTLSATLTQKQVYNIIKKTKLNKAVGFGGIYFKLFKFAGPTIYTWLTIFYNDIIDTGK